MAGLIQELNGNVFKFCMWVTSQVGGQEITFMLEHALHHQTITV